MLQIRRNFYNNSVLSGTDKIAAALGTQLLPNDILLYRNSQEVYGIVNAAGTAVVLALY